VLQPGDRLDLDQLTAEFGISRTPIREALLELSYEGLVEITPRSGMAVVGITPEDAVDNFAILAALAGKAAEMATGRMTPTELAELADLADAIEGSDDVVAAMLADLRLDSRFVIIEASAVGDAPGAFTLAEFADAAIIAIEVNATRRSDVEDCLQRLNRLGTVALGAAVIPATGADRLRPRTDAATSGRVRPVAPSAHGTGLAGGQRQPPSAGSDAESPETPARSDRTPDKDPADSAAGA